MRTDKRGPTIKINGIKRNPNLHLSEVEPEHREEQEQGPLYSAPEEELPAPAQQQFEQELVQQDAMGPIPEDVEVMQEPVQEPTPDAANVQEIAAEELSEPADMVQEQVMQEIPEHQPELEHPSNSRMSDKSKKQRPCLINSSST